MAKTDMLMNSEAMRRARNVSTIDSPPISGGSIAATALRKNQSESRNRNGSARSSARARSSCTVLPASRWAAASPPTLTPACPRKSLATRSAVFESSALFLSQPITYVERPSFDRSVGSLSWYQVATRPTPGSAASVRAALSTRARVKSRMSTTRPGSASRPVAFWIDCEVLTLSLAGSSAP